MTIPIEKNVPLPEPEDGAGIIVPELELMVPGDSIFIPNETGKKFPPVLAVQVSTYGILTQKLFKTKYEDNGLRVWRVE